MLLTSLDLQVETTVLVSFYLIIIAKPYEGSIIIAGNFGGIKFGELQFY